MGYEYRAPRSEIIMKPVRHLMVVREDPEDEPLPEPVKPALRPCGTHAAHNRHVRAGEPIDAACREAERLRNVEARARRRAGLAPGVRLAPCGTRTAYDRHIRKGEPVDEACRQAYLDWAEARRAKGNK